MNSERIIIKGIRQGLLVTLREGEWSGLMSALQAHLGENPDFFRGGRMAIDVSDRELMQAQIEEVRSMVARHQVELWALLSEDATTQSEARRAGLVTELPWTRGPQHPSEEAKEPPGRSVVVRRTLRSGQSLRHPGHVVVIGDVNPGAEVVAGGSIVVWGRLRGLVHAGALGDEEAVICALELAPTQLRIAGHISRSPEERPSKPLPEKASICDGSIVAVPWPGE
ncbi:MAG: septum site-determining protein MinC [Anaerolineae bacterium]